MILVIDPSKPGYIPDDNDYDRELRSLNGFDEEELDGIKDFFQKVGGAVKNVVSNFVAPKSGSQSQQPQIIVQQPAMPAPEKSNTALIVGLGLAAVATIGVGVYLYNSQRKATLNGEGETQDLGEAEEVEVAEIIDSPTLNGKRPRRFKRQEALEVE